MIGKLLRQFSIDTGIGQKEIAQALNFSPQRVNNYFRDMAEPPKEFFDLFKKVYKVDLKVLMEKAGKDGTIKISHMKPIPVFDFDFTPINSPDFLTRSDAVRYYIDAPMISDCDAVVKVSGEAMQPEFTPSDFIALKKIEDLNTLPFGNAFYIVTKEQRLLRYIKPGDKLSLKLTAANPAFDDITVAKKDIVYLFQVMSKVTRIA